MITSSAIRNKLVLDLWEVVDDFGECRVISPSSWCQRYRPKLDAKSSMRSWTRFKARIRQSPFPVEFVPCEGRQRTTRARDSYGDRMGTEAPRGHCPRYLTTSRGAKVPINHSQQQSRNQK